MNTQPGAYIEKDGQILPDLTDEAMAGRKKLADETAKKAKPEVSDVKK